MKHKLAIGVVVVGLAAGGVYLWRRKRGANGSINLSEYYLQGCNCMRQDYDTDGPRTPVPVARMFCADLLADKDAQAHGCQPLTPAEKAGSALWSAFGGLS